MSRKLLYISVNSKPENLSSSKSVARDFINKFLEKNKDFEVEEVDLYKEHIPRLEYQYFESRNCIINEEATKKLLIEKDKKPKGLLEDKKRALVYIQSSGGSIPWILDPIMDKGENYIASIMKLMGIKDVIELKVDGTGTTEEERQNSINKAKEKSNDIINGLDFN